MDPVEKAFDKVNRKYFVPDELVGSVDVDSPLPIGFGQAVSQPTTVKMMLDWLEPEPGNKVLDVGSGSGWTSALLAYLVGPKGKVFAVERIPELLDFGRQNVRKLDFIKNVKFFQAGKKFGLPAHAPYDRILVSASAQRLPEELLEQLKPDGKLVIPVGYDILEIEKNRDGQIETTAHPGFVFVPLIG
jgi:protein-L-isoaspartate(D-aspartate) O-methyltransferase